MIVGPLESALDSGLWRRRAPTRDVRARPGLQCRGYIRRGPGRQNFLWRQALEKQVNNQKGQRTWLRPTGPWLVQPVGFNHSV